MWKVEWERQAEHDIVDLEDRESEEKDSEAVHFRHDLKMWRCDTSWSSDAHD